MLKPLQADEAARFGSVELTQAGISVDGQSAKWEDVRKFEFAYDRGSKDIYMCVECRSSEPLTGQLREIPHMWAMFCLISAIRPKTAEKTPGADG